MFDFGRSHDLLVADPLARAVTHALPGWRIFNIGESLPDDAAPVAGIVPAGDDLAGLDAAGFTGLPIVRVADVVSLSLDLAEVLADRLHAARRDAAEARRAAALLRRENEEQIRRMRMLENFAHALGGPRYLKALDWAPSSFFVELSQAVTQRLPLNVVALAAIDLWLPDAEPEEAAATVIELLDADAAPIARLSAERPVGRGAGAWVRFSAEEPLAGPARDAVLKVVPPPGRAVALGLSTPAPDPRFGVHMDGAAVADAPLAARVWRADYLASLPPANGPAGAPSPGAAEARVHSLSLRDLGAPELLFRPPLATDYVDTAYWEREDAFLLHPSADGPVCAILRDVDLSHVAGISALVQVAHRDAPVLGFAVGACPRGLATSENWRDHIGPYVFLPPGAWGECHHIIPAAVGARTDVLLSTMIAANRSNDNAWALFHSLRLTSEVPK